MTVLGDVLTLEYGKPLDSARRDPDGAVPVYGANGVKTFTTTPLVTQPTIVVGRKGSAGELVLVDQPCWPLDVTYYVTHDSAKTDLRYLFFFMSLCNLPSFARGVKPGINRNDIYGIQFQSPPLAEQQRIVAKLDVAIEIVSELEQVAFERRRLFGEFARSWLAGVLERTGGKVEKLGDLASVDYGERVVRARDGGTRYPVYGGGGATFSVDRSNRRDCFIISRFGMSEKCVRYVEGEFFLNDSGLSVSTRDEESLRQEFLDRVLLARQAEIYSLGAGTAQRNLDINKFKQMQLTVPPVEVQDKIVAEYDAVSGVCGAAEQSYSHRAGNVRSLRQSVLAAAFRGDL